MLNAHETALKEHFRKNAMQGMRLTIIQISQYMAHTVRKQIEIAGEMDGKKTFRAKGEKKTFIESDQLFEDSIFLKGWNDDIKADSEFNCWAGNAKFNLISVDEKTAMNIIEQDSFFMPDRSVMLNILWKPLHKANDSTVFEGSPLYQQSINTAL